MQAVEQATPVSATMRHRRRETVAQAAARIGEGVIVEALLGRPNRNAAVDRSLNQFPREKSGDVVAPFSQPSARAAAASRLSASSMIA